MTLLYLSRHAETLDNALKDIRKNYVKRTGERVGIHYDPELKKFTEKDSRKSITPKNLIKYVSQFGVTLEEISKLTGYDLTKPGNLIIPNITPKSVDSARKLGRYLGGIIKPREKTIIVSSNSPRTLRTTEIAAREISYRLEKGSNHFVQHDLMERVAIEFLKTDAERESRRNNPHFATKEEIALQTYIRFMSLIEDHSPDNIVGILHGARNMAFLGHYLNRPELRPSNGFMDNCGMWVLEIHEGKISVVENHKKNSEL